MAGGVHLVRKEGDTADQAARSVPAQGLAVAGGTHQEPLVRANPYRPPRQRSGANPRRNKAVSSPSGRAQMVPKGHHEARSEADQDRRAHGTPRPEEGG
jgi:hypothetical protein